MKQVEYIGQSNGPRGGRLWVLLLECGHIVHRPGPTGYISGDWVRKKPKPAPKRVRCAFCDAGVPSAKELISARVKLIDRDCPIGSWGDR